MKRIFSWWWSIPVGTRSILVGAHAFWIHWLYVAIAWTKIYGFPTDARLWLAFLIHDWGYWGKPNMDGHEGEKHVEWAAHLMHRFDGEKIEYLEWNFNNDKYTTQAFRVSCWEWHNLCLYHSRHYAKKHRAQPSRLCFADKLAFSYQIKWLYLLGVRLSGELDEYLANARKSGKISSLTASCWYDDLKVYMEKWVADHKDGQIDTVTEIRN